jgi:TFIIF-interacting CTD phosphatase-like protein
MSLDLNKLENKLDEALSNETSESLNRFLNDKRMSNNKQQTVVDWLEQINNHCKKYGRTIEHKDIEQAKEIHKKQMCKFAYKCHNHYKVYGDFNIEHFYNETYGGNK